MLGRQLDRLRAGRRLERAVPRRPEDVAEQLHVLLVVLDDEDLLAGHGYADLAGSVNTNVLPWPSSLSTQIRPPCSSTSRFESASPRPVPSRCSTPASVCWNSSKIRSWSSRGDAGPGVGDGHPHLAVDLRRADVDRAPGGRELHGVREQVEDHLPDPALVAVDDVDVRARRRARPRTPSFVARSRTITTPRSSASRSENGATSSSICPASTFDRSRMSLISASRWWPRRGCRRGTPPASR